MSEPAVQPAEDDAPTPAERSRDYRHALGSFATGVTVVTCRAPDGRRIGLTVNSFASVSLEPRLVSWCLARTALSFPDFEAAPTFAVNVLSVEQEPLVYRFAQRTLEDRFEGLNVASGLGGAPLLDGSAARFECRNAAIHPGGDHVIFVGEVERYARFEHEPLVLMRGRFGRLGDDA